MKRLLPLAMLLLVVSACRDRQPPNAKALQAYVNEDLRALDGQRLEGFLQVAAHVTGEAPQRPGGGPGQTFEAWWVKPLANGNIAWAYLEAYPGYEVPDVSGVRIHFFDKNWDYLSDQTFPTGYRFFLEDVELRHDNPLHQDLLVVRVTCTGPFFVDGDKKHPAFEQGDFQRQYYGLLGGRFVLIRLEDNEGRLAVNNYTWRAPSKGPEVPKRTPEEWIRSLSASDPVEQLATLVWLSGGHLPSTEPRETNVNQEFIADSKILEAVRASPETYKALAALQHSPNPWVQEYVELALKMAR